MFSHLYIFFEGKRQGRWREGKKREKLAGAQEKREREEGKRKQKNKES